MDNEHVFFSNKYTCTSNMCLIDSSPIAASCSSVFQRSRRHCVMISRLVLRNSSWERERKRNGEERADVREGLEESVWKGWGGCKDGGRADNMVRRWRRGGGGWSCQGRDQEGWDVDGSWGEAQPRMLMSHHCTFGARGVSRSELYPSTGLHGRWWHPE